MGKCTICAHPQREAIDRDLVGGNSFRNVADRFGVSPTAAFRHSRDHIPADLARAVAAADSDRAGRLRAHADALDAAANVRAADLLAELQVAMARVGKLLDACDRWLVDPDDPRRYDIGPRAAELMVHYTTPGPDGEPRPARAPLSELLEQVSAGGRLKVQRVEGKHADPRELLLKAAHRLEAELLLVGRLLGQVADGQATTVNVLNASPEWVRTREAILRALEPYGNARSAVVEAIQRVSGNG